MRRGSKLHNTFCFQVLLDSSMRFCPVISYFVVSTILIFVQDVRKLLPEGLIPEPLAAGIARAFNSKTNRVVTTPSGAKVDNMLTPRS